MASTPPDKKSPDKARSPKSIPSNTSKTRCRDVLQTYVDLVRRERNPAYDRVMRKIEAEERLDRQTLAEFVRDTKTNLTVDIDKVMQGKSADRAAALANTSNFNDCECSRARRQIAPGKATSERAADG